MDIKKGTRRNIFNRYENIFLLLPIPSILPLTNYS